jgi:cell division transport system permease protein
MWWVPPGATDQTMFIATLSALCISHLPPFREFFLILWIGFAGMNLRYILSESFSGFRRTKLSSAVSVFTVTVSLALFGVFVTLSLNAARVLDDIRSRVEVEFYLSESLKLKDALLLTVELKKDEAVQSAVFISKDSAAAIFRRDFGDDLLAVLGTNPLPQSVKVRLKPAYATLDSLEEFVKSVKDTDGITDARYNKEFLSGLDRNTRILFYITIGLGVMIALAAMALVSNTIRLAIHAKREMIRTMKLVGATQGFIRTPFLLEGIYQGFLGSVFAISVIIGVLMLLRLYYRDIYDVILPPNPIVYAALVGLGCLLGLFGSWISVRKFIGEAV